MPASTSLGGRQGYRKVGGAIIRKGLLLAVPVPMKVFSIGGSGGLGITWGFLSQCVVLFLFRVSFLPGGMRRKIQVHLTWQPFQISFWPRWRPFQGSAHCSLSEFQIWPQAQKIWEPWVTGMDQCSFVTRSSYYHFPPMLENVGSQRAEQQLAIELEATDGNPYRWFPIPTIDYRVFSSQTFPH